MRCPFRRHKLLRILPLIGVSILSPLAPRVPCPLIVPILAPRPVTALPTGCVRHRRDGAETGSRRHSGGDTQKRFESKPCGSATEHVLPRERRAINALDSQPATNRQTKHMSRIMHEATHVTRQAAWAPTLWLKLQRKLQALDYDHDWTTTGPTTTPTRFITSRDNLCKVCKFSKKKPRPC